MRLHFDKLHGLGNDFVVIDNMSKDIELSSNQVISICDRHTGIGADGVILVESSELPECSGYMNYINSDGTLAQMCGNGVRCVAKFLVDKGIVDKDSNECVVDTMSGPKPIRFITDSDGLLEQATVDMGMPVFEPSSIPVNAQCDKRTDDGIDYVGNLRIDSDWGTFSFCCISMGNPHAVCIIDDFDKLPDSAFVSMPKSIDTLDVDSLGSYFESHLAFPEKANIEFVDITGAQSRFRVYERGCAETLACGTGACAVGVALSLNEGMPKNKDVGLTLGVLNIDWRDDGHVYMTGPAERSFTGDLEV